MGNALSFRVRLVNNGHPRNTRLFFSILLFFLLTSIANTSFAQRISLQRASIPVADLLEELTEQSGLNFSYAPKLIDGEERISFRIRRATIKEALDLLAEKLDIGYTLLENQIILHEKEIGLNETETYDPSAYYTISGFVNDASSGESLIGATVSVEGTTQGVSTNAFGFYVLRLPAGEHSLLFSYLGFEVQRLVIALAKNKKQDIPLAPAVQELPGVIVNNNTVQSVTNQQSGAMELRASDLENLPEFGGETGLIRSLQTLPGIKGHSDGSAFFFVRGGEKDQNLTIIDDAPIYNPSHLFGFYSVVIPDFTKSIKVYKSDVPVHLGDRLSSVVDIRTRDGNLKKTEFSAALNPLLVRLSLEGPIRKGKSSYFLSTRFSNFKWLYKEEYPNHDIGFSDLNFKWNVKFNDKNRLYYTLFVGDDRVRVGQNFSGVNNVGWQNVTNTIRWNHIFGAKLFMNTVLYSGNYNYRMGNQKNGAENNQWESGIGRASLKSDYTYYHRPERTWRFGIEFNGFTFNTGKVSGEEWGSIFPKIENDKAQQTVLYVNRSQQWKDKWDLSIGLRYSVFRNIGPNTYFTYDENYDFQDSVVVESGVYQKYRQLDPRLKLTYKIDSSSSLKFSYGIYHQNLQLITNSSSPFNALEVWLPSSPNIKPQRAHQVNLSYVKQFPKREFSFTGELYYKKLSNQIDYVNHANTLLNPLLEGELRFGKMNAYGIELMFEKKVGRFSGWFNYTYSRALRQTDAVNNGNVYPAFQDRPHDFSLMVSYALKRRIMFSAFWTAYTGAAFSSPTGFYTFNNNTVPIYDEKHNDRLPNYRRLDIAFKFVLNKKPTARYRHDLTFSIYNFLARKNIVAVNFNQVLNEEDEPEPAIKANLLLESDLIVSQAYLLRFFPSLTYKMQL